METQKQASKDNGCFNYEQLYEKVLADVSETADKVFGLAGFASYNFEYVGGQQDDCFYALVEFHTSAGQDVVVEFNFDGTKEDFAKKLLQEANSYDVDERVAIFINSLGKNGVPSTARELLEDCEEAKESLSYLASLFHKEVYGEPLENDANNNEGVLFLLRDLESGEVDAVIKTTTSTKEEVMDIIAKTKDDLEDVWSLDDILENLPDDCEVLAGYTECRQDDFNIYY